MPLTITVDVTCDGCGATLVPPHEVKQDRIDSTRPDEIGRLEWQHVCLATRTIRVKTANAKDRDRRIVEIQPNLAAWLAPLVRPKGRVLKLRLDQLRVAARGVLGLSAWPQDIMRHTFASYHFGEFRDEAYTKHQMGHRDDGRIFYNHYCVPVSRPEAAKFWATVPPVAFLEMPADVLVQQAA